MMKLFKFTVLAMFFSVIFVSSMAMNLVLHEGAHYAVADALGMHPQIHFTPDNISSKNFFSMDTEIAYVQYSSATSDVTKDDALVALAGPLADLSLGALGVGLFFKTKRTKVAKMLLIFLVIPALVSFAINIFPTYPADGYYVFQYLLS
jgi:Zn-dependent protease